MTIDRVVIDSTAASPLRVSVHGTSAAVAEFNTLIFDGNQPPLRLWATGYGAVAGISQNQFNLGKNVNEATIGSNFITPSGTAAMFLCTIHGTRTPPNDPYRTPWWLNQGNLSIGGMGMCSGLAIAISFDHVNLGGGAGDPNAQPPPSIVSYCVFKNHN